MAAETITSDVFKVPGVYRAGFPGLIRRIRQEASNSYLNEAGDIYKAFKLPKGAKVSNGRLKLSDIDTHATPTIVVSVEVYDGTTTKVLIHESTIGQGGGEIQSTGLIATETAIGFVVDNDDYYVRIIVDTAAATTAAGTLHLEVDYICDLDQGDL